MVVGATGLPGFEHAAPCATGDSRNFVEPFELCPTMNSPEKVPCARCAVRLARKAPDTPLCAVCAGAGAVRWHLTDWSRWLPQSAACGIAASATILFCGTFLLIRASGVLNGPRVHVSLGFVEGLRLAAQLWWGALGAPAQVSFFLSPVRFEGAVRISAMVLNVLPAVVLMLAGWLMARILAARGEWEHLVAGLLVAPPMGILSALLAGLLPFSMVDVEVGDVTLSRIACAVSPWHAFAVTLLWGAIWASVGALLRHAFVARHVLDRWAAFRSGFLPAICGALLALLCGLVLSTAVSSVQLSQRDPVRPPLTVGDISQWKGTLAAEALGTVIVGLITEPLAFDSGAAIRGRVVVAASDDEMQKFAGVPTDSILLLYLGGGVSAEQALVPPADTGTPPAAVWASFPSGWKAWVILPLLCSVIGGMAAAALARTRNSWLLGLEVGVFYALGVTAVTAWFGVWVYGQLQTGDSSAAGVTLWALWRGRLWSTWLTSVSIGWLGGMPGVLLGRGWPRPQGDIVEEISPVN